MELRRPTEADVAEMLEVQRSAFEGNALSQRCFPRDPSSTASNDSADLGKIRDSLPDITLAVASEEGQGESQGQGQGQGAGRILGWARWVRRPAPAAAPAGPPSLVDPATFPPNGDPELAARYFQANRDSRADIVGRCDHWFLSTLVVRSDAQGRGVGSLLIRPGLDAADEEGWVVYVNSSPEAEAFYKRFGFETRRTSRFTEDIVSYHMLRDAAPDRCHP